MLEGVGKLLPVRSIGEAESRQIGCDDVIMIAQNWDEIAEHMGRGRESVQQENGWGGFRAGFAIEDSVAVYRGMLIGDHESSFVGSESALRPRQEGDYITPVNLSITVLDASEIF